jgi:hypothetical protein
MPENGTYSRLAELARSYAVKLAPHRYPTGIKRNFQSTENAHEQRALDNCLGNFDNPDRDPEMKCGYGPLFIWNMTALAALAIWALMAYLETQP